MTQQQVQIIYVPPTTARTVVFPLKNDTKTFYTDFYSPELTDNKVSLEEVDQFISKIHMVSQARTQPSATDSDCWFCGGLLVFLGSWIGFYFLMKIYSHALYIGEIIGFTLFMIQWSGLVRSLCHDRPQGPARLDSSDPKFKYQDIVDEQNEILRSRGLKWNLPQEFPLWIELTKDLKKQAHEFQVETEEKITFHLVQRRCSKDFYEPETTDGRISHEEMYQFISKINQNLRMPPEYRCCDWENWIKILFFDVWLFALIEFSKYLSDLLSVLLSVVVVVVFMLITAAVRNFASSIKEKKTQVELRVRSQELVGEFNNENLKSQGLRWDVPSQIPVRFDLYKDYKNQNTRSQRIEMPLYNEERGSLAINTDSDIEAGTQNVNVNVHQNVNQGLKNDGYAQLVEDNN